MLQTQEVNTLDSVKVYCAEANVDKCQGCTIVTDGSCGPTFGLACSAEGEKSCCSKKETARTCIRPPANGDECLSEYSSVQPEPVDQSTPSFWKQLGDSLDFGTVFSGGIQVGPNGTFPLLKASGSFLQGDHAMILVEHEKPFLVFESKFFCLTLPSFRGRVRANSDGSMKIALTGGGPGPVKATSGAQPILTLRNWTVRLNTTFGMGQYVGSPIDKCCSKLEAVRVYDLATFGHGPLPDCTDGDCGGSCEGSFSMMKEEWAFVTGKPWLCEQQTSSTAPGSNRNCYPMYINEQQSRVIYYDRQASRQAWVCAKLDSGGREWIDQGKFWESRLGTLVDNENLLAFDKYTTVPSQSDRACPASDRGGYHAFQTRHFGDSSIFKKPRYDYKAKTGWEDIQQNDELRISCSADTMGEVSGDDKLTMHATATATLWNGLEAEISGTFTKEMITQTDGENVTSTGAHSYETQFKLMHAGGWSPPILENSWADGFRTPPCNGTIDFGSQRGVGLATGKTRDLTMEIIARYAAPVHLADGRFKLSGFQDESSGPSMRLTARLGNDQICQPGTGPCDVDDKNISGSLRLVVGGTLSLPNLELVPAIGAECELGEPKAIRCSLTVAPFTAYTSDFLTLTLPGLIGSAKIKRVGYRYLGQREGDGFVKLHTELKTTEAVGGIRIGDDFTLDDVTVSAFLNVKRLDFPPEGQERTTTDYELSLGGQATFGGPKGFQAYLQGVLTPGGLTGELSHAGGWSLLDVERDGWLARRLPRSPPFVADFVLNSTMVSISTDLRIENETSLLGGFLRLQPNAWITYRASVTKIPEEERSPFALNPFRLDVFMQLEANMLLGELASLYISGRLEPGATSKFQLAAAGTSWAPMAAMDDVQADESYVSGEIVFQGGEDGDRAEGDEGLSNCHFLDCLDFINRISLRLNVGPLPTFSIGDVFTIDGLQLVMQTGIGLEPVDFFHDGSPMPVAPEGGYLRMMAHGTATISIREGEPGFTATIGGSIDVASKAATLTLAHAGGWAPMTSLPSLKTPEFSATLTFDEKGKHVRASASFAEAAYILPNGALTLYGASSKETGPEFSVAMTLPKEGLEVRPAATPPNCSDVAVPPAPQLHVASPCSDVAPLIGSVSRVLQPCCGTIVIEDEGAREQDISPRECSGELTLDETLVTESGRPVYKGLLVHHVDDVEVYDWCVAEARTHTPLPHS